MFKKLGVQAYTFRSYYDGETATEQTENGTKFRDGVGALVYNMEERKKEDFQ